MKAKDFRSLAWNSLGCSWTGRIWGTFAVIALLHTVLSAVSGMLMFAVVGLAITIVISGPLCLGLAIVATDAARGYDISVESYFSGFNNFATSLLLWLLNQIFIFLWSLLFIIPGIVKTYSYSMSFFILRDNPTMSQDEARRMSISMMRGNKWRLFCLDFSFIGWGILCVLTFGILTFWVMPYMQTARAHFYQDLINRATAPQAPQEPQTAQ